MGQYKSVRKLVLAALLVLSVLALGHSEVAAATSTAGQSQTLALAASSPAYDMVASDGGIFSFGDATFYGSMGGTVLNKPIVGMASTPDGKGYWMAASDGGVFAFGRAGFYGSMGGTVLNQPIVGIASLSTDPYATGQVGADVSFPQCPYPTINQPGIQAFPTNTGVGVVGVNFEAVDITPGTAFPAWNQSYATNPCLGSEFQMAQAAGAHASLYAVLWTPSAPSSGDSQLFTGPESACASATPNTSATSLDCQAYDWGYNIATADLSYAAAQGAYSNLWWLDVEGPYSTSSAMLWGSDTTVNENVIAGAVAAFQSAGRQVGIYSTYYQFPRIAGSTYSPGLPIWMATGDTVGNLPWYCTAPSFFFGGGTPWLIQGAPTQLSAGSNSYNVDPDYAC